MILKTGKIFLFLVLTGCVAPIEQKDLQKNTICFVNMQAIVDAIASDDTEWKNVRDQIKSHVQEQGKSADVKSYENKLSLLRKRDQEMKAGVYSIINSALNEVAKKKKVHFIFNLGDSLVYGRSEYDLTADVLEECRTVRGRSDPLLR